MYAVWVLKTVYICIKHIQTQTQRQTHTHTQRVRPERYSFTIQFEKFNVKWRRKGVACLAMNGEKQWTDYCFFLFHFVNTLAYVVYNSSRMYKTKCTWRVYGNILYQCSDRIELRTNAMCQMNIFKSFDVNKHNKLLFQFVYINVLFVHKNREMSKSRILRGQHLTCGLDFDCILSTLFKSAYVELLRDFSEPS